MRDPFEWAENDDDNLPIIFPNYSGEPNYPVPALAARSNAKHEEDQPGPIDLAPFNAFHQPQRAKPKTGTIVAFITLGLLVSYCAVNSERSSNNRSASPVAPGWDELGSCSDTMSLDKNRGLTLAEDGGATLTDYAARQQDNSAKPAIEHDVWKYDLSSKRLFLTLDGIEVTYMLVFPDHISTCMLIKGDLSAADLTESWFSIPGDSDSGEYVSPADRY